MIVWKYNESGYAFAYTYLRESGNPALFLMQRKEDDVTPKQRKFCYEYLKDLNAKAAAIRAGYSKKTAEVTGCK